MKPSLKNDSYMHFNNEESTGRILMAWQKRMLSIKESKVATEQKPVETSKISDSYQKAIDEY